MRRTKIVATLGPSSSSYKNIRALAMTGVNVFRVNFSHGDIQQYQDAFDNIKSVREELNLPISIMADTRGPELRICEFEGGSASIKRGATFVLYYDSVLGNQSGASVTHKECLTVLKRGDIVLANDGLMKFKVEDNTDLGVVMRAQNSGVLKNHKSIYLKNIPLKLPYLNELDERDLKWCIANGCDLIAMSFVNEVSDVEAIKKLLPEKNMPRLIAKIESSRGVENVDAILDHCDGLMVARGDLGVEIAQGRLPKIQHILIDKARRKSKISIVATEMLESMISSLRPTRAEINDVANAVYQGASAVMLSAETAVGVNPIRAVKTMSDIATQAEKDINYLSDYQKMAFVPHNITDILGSTTVETAFKINAKAIVIYTDHGKIATLLSRYQPKCPIVAITANDSTYNYLAVARDVMPVKTDKIPDDIFTYSCDVVKSIGVAKPGDRIIVTTGTTDNVSLVLKIAEIK